MTPERFRTLSEAYGAAIEHWPTADRAAALALIERQDPATLTALAEARQLDQLLATHRVAAPTAELTSKLLASAQPIPQRAGLRRWISNLRSSSNRQGVSPENGVQDLPRGTRLSAGPSSGFPAQRRAPFRTSGLLRGLGWASVGLAGIATGVVVMSLLTQTATTQSLAELSYSSTAFGGATQDWSNE